MSPTCQLHPTEENPQVLDSWVRDDDLRPAETIRKTLLRTQQSVQVRDHSAGIPILDDQGNESHVNDIESTNEVFRWIRKDVPSIKFNVDGKPRLGRALIEADIEAVELHCRRQVPGHV